MKAASGSYWSISPITLLSPYLTYYPWTSKYNGVEWQPRNVMVLKEFCVVADGGAHGGGGVAFFRQSTLSVDDLSQQPWSEFMMVMTLCHSVQVGLRMNS